MPAPATLWWARPTHIRTRTNTLTHSLTPRETTASKRAASSTAPKSTYWTRLPRTASSSLPPFPYSDSFASFPTGQSVTFYQGRGQFDRGLRNYLLAGYVQDEWRITPRLTFNYGLRYEINTPFSEIRNRLNEWAPGQQST